MEQKRREWREAVDQGDDRKVEELLLKYGPQAFAATVTDLNSAASKGCDKIVSQLLTAKPYLTDFAEYRWNALHYAATNGHNEVVKQLLTKADVVGPSKR